MFDLFRAKRKLKKAELAHQVAELETASKILAEARNTIIEDEDESNWVLAGQVGGIGYQDEVEQQSMLASAYNLYHTNPHARAIVRNLVKFTLGKGPQVIPDDDNVKAKEVWEDFKKKNKL